MFNNRTLNYSFYKKAIDQELVENVLSGYNENLDLYREQSIEMDNSLSEVFGSEYPSFMSIQRPNQTKKQIKYRKDYFEKTGNPVLGYLGQIEKQVEKPLISVDCNILFQSKNKVSYKDSFQNYLTNDYYNGRSFMDSFRESIKSKVLLEPNTVLMVLPNEQKGSYAEPYFMYAKAENIILYKANELCVIKSELKADVKQGNEVIYGHGDIYYFFDKKKYLVAQHIGYDEKGLKQWSLNTVGGEYRNHGCNFLPCMKIGRKIVEASEDGFELRTSDVYDSLVFLRNAIMNFIDLAVEHNFHSASQEWVLGLVECNTCRGSGRVKDIQGGQPKVCDSCGGGGQVPTMKGDGLDKTIVPNTRNELGKTEKGPTVIGGFVVRPEYGSKLFKDAFENNILKALQPFGLEHLMKMPYNQSGAAKDYDMNEGHNFVMASNYQIQSLLKMVLDSILCMRYKSLEERQNQYYNLLMPKSFNLTSKEGALDKLKDSVTYKYPEKIQLKYTRNVIEKEYGDDSLELMKFDLKVLFDPMPNNTIIEKMSASEYYSVFDFTLSLRFDEILNRLFEEVIGFEDLSLSEKKDLIYNKVKLYINGKKRIEQQG